MMFAEEKYEAAEHFLEQMRETTLDRKVFVFNLDAFLLRIFTFDGLGRGDVGAFKQCHDVGTTKGREHERLP